MQNQPTAWAPQFNWLRGCNCEKNNGSARVNMMPTLKNTQACASENISFFVSPLNPYCFRFHATNTRIQCTLQYVLNYLTSGCIARDLCSSPISPLELWPKPEFFLCLYIRLPQSLPHYFRGHGFHFRGQSRTTIHFRSASANISIVEIRPGVRNVF